MAGKLYYLHTDGGGKLTNNLQTRCPGGTVYELYHRCDNKSAIPSHGFDAGDVFVFNGTFGVITEDVKFKTYPPTEAGDTDQVWVAVDGIARVKTVEELGTNLRAREIFIGPCDIPGEVTATGDIVIAQKATHQTRANEGRYYLVGFCVSNPIDSGDETYTYVDVLLNSSRNSLTRVNEEPTPTPTDTLEAN